MARKENIKVSITLKIDGNLYKAKEITYTRGRETNVYTLDDLARVVLVWERIFDDSSTYAMDGFLQDAEKRLGKKDGETAQSVFEKYWINFKKTWEEEFDRKNKGDKGSEISMFPEQNDFLVYELLSTCRGFNDNVLQVKLGFLYWLYKYVMDGKIDNFLEEIENIPDYIKGIVDNKVTKQ